MTTIDARLCSLDGTPEKRTLELLHFTARGSGPPHFAPSGESAESLTISTSAYVV
jgi:hypothetical protein